MNAPIPIRYRHVCRDPFLPQRASHRLCRRCRSWDVLRALGTEIAIVVIYAADMRAGCIPSHRHHQRYLLACSRIIQADGPSHAKRWRTIALRNGERDVRRDQAGQMPGRHSPTQGLCIASIAGAVCGTRYELDALARIIGNAINEKYCKRIADYRGIAQLIYSRTRDGIAHDDSPFDAAPPGIAADGTFYHMNGAGVERLKLAPEHLARFAVPVASDEKHQRPLFDGLIAATFPLTDDDHQEQRALLQEHFGGGRDRRRGAGAEGDALAGGVLPDSNFSTR